MNNEIEKKKKEGEMTNDFLTCSKSLPTLDWIKTSHPVNPFITFVQAGKKSTFRINGVSVGGLTAKIRTVFFPQYSHESLIQSISASSLPSLPPSLPSPFTRKRKWGKSASQLKKQGMSRGIRLDRHITDMVDLTREYHLKSEFFFPIIGKKRSLNNKEVEERIAIYTLPSMTELNEKQKQVRVNKLKRCLNVRMMHGFLLWKKWNDLGLKCIATQITVGITGICGTNIDVLLTNAYHQLFITEVKSGDSTYWKSSTQNAMQAPFKDLSDSRMNQAIIQASCGKFLYLHTFPALRDHLGPALVFRVSGEEVEWHTVPNSIQERIPNAMNYLMGYFNRSPSSFLQQNKK